jgi:hypothetical protein
MLPLQQNSLLPFISITQSTAPAWVCLKGLYAIQTGHYSVGCLDVVTGRFGKGVDHCSRQDRICLVCMSGSVDEHRFLPHIQSHTSALQLPFSSGSILKIVLLRSSFSGQYTDQPNLLGNYLEACLVQSQSVLASPLVVWLLSFAELKRGVVALTPSFITASCLQLFGALLSNALNI